MKIKEILDKLNKFYADLIRDGKDGDVIRAIQDPDYLNEIWAQLETMDDSVWIENFWNKLVELSKSGDDQKIEQLQKSKENIIPKKLFRFRPTAVPQLFRTSQAEDSQWVQSFWV